MQKATDSHRVKFRIMGEVQGVGLRAWICAQAQQKNLAGWVCNEADQSVAALFIGPGSSLANINEWLSQGSSSASVIDICELALDDSDLNWDPSTGFKIIQCR